MRIKIIRVHAEETIETAMGEVVGAVVDMVMPDQSPLSLFVPAPVTETTIRDAVRDWMANLPTEDHELNGAEITL